jgi:hypothetical protein
MTLVAPGNPSDQKPVTYVFRMGVRNEVPKVSLWVVIPDPNLTMAGSYREKVTAVAMPCERLHSLNCRVLSHS